MAKNKQTICGFCGREFNNIPEDFLPSGFEGMGICGNCLRAGNAALQNLKGNGKKSQIAEAVSALKIPSPAEIKAELDRYCIGQDEAKKTLAVAVRNHYKRLQTKFMDPDAAASLNEVEIDKSNVLLIGPTGSGKTLLASTLAKMLDVPFAIADATTLTEAGYVGEDVENILLRLYQAADGDIERTQIGIIYVDEIDKIARKGENMSITRDVSGEGVQQALLKILEGTVANVPPQGGRKHPNQECLHIDTTNILFICGGAFCGLSDIVKRRCGRRLIGFDDEKSTGEDVMSPEEFKENPFAFCEPGDLVRFGLIPEIVGRLPVLTSLAPLTGEDLVKVLSEPKNALIKQYQRLMAMDDVELKFTPDALELIAEKAVKRGTGARGLRALLEELMLDAMFEAPGKAGGVCRIDAAAVRKGAAVIRKR
ncbi:MAG: ATP-dependent Clp protease ATP-binding subunit ClpX [Lentisphaeria bacterium]|nr:ATP-dependent Clp protease ATP-binding subunit ClpX [Lentisphaeria bacterium]